MMASTVIEVTVKTLDSQNHQFSVPEDMLVRSFKDEISATIGIPADQQRLIFRGRVLQDQQKMSEYNVANNTVHVVQRPSNAIPNRNNDEPSRLANRTGGDGGASNTIIMGTIGFPMDMQGGGGRPRTRNSAAYRIQVGNQMLGQASSLLRLLEAEDSVAQTLESAAAAAAATEDSSTTEDEESGQNIGAEGADDESPMDIDMDDPNAIGRMISQLANAHATAAVVATLRPVQAGGTSNATAATSGGGGGGGGGTLPVTAEQIHHQPSIVNIPVGIREGSDTPSRPRPEAPRLREMSTLIQDVLAFQQRLVPYLRYVENVLHSNRLYQNQEELASTQYVYETVSSIMHYLSHSFHALSDLMCDFSSPPETRRLRAPTSVLVEQSTVLRATIPFHPGMMSTNQPQQPNTNQNTQQPTPASPAAPTNTSQPNAAPGSRPQPQQQQGSPRPAAPSGGSQHQFPMFPGLSGGTFGQAQLNLGGGGMPFNFPQGAFSIGGGGGQGSGGGFVIPDLSNILGPNIAANMMNLASAGAQAGFNAAAAAANNGRAPPNTAQQQQQTGPQQPPSSGTQQARAPGAGAGATSQQQPPPTSGAGGAETGPQQQQQQQQIRGGVDFGRPFDVILSCHSHHNGQRGQRRPSRPENFRHHVQVDSSGDQQVARSPSQDFLLNLVDFLKNSNVLTLLQPILKEIITNYLMRGRDVNNQGHLRSCAKSLAKTIAQALTNFANQIPERMQEVMYSNTFSSLVTDFFNDILEITLRPPAEGEYKRDVLVICERYLSDLINVFKYCLGRDPSYLAKFVKLILDTFVGGTQSIFRENVAINLRDYLTSLTPQRGSADGSAPPSVVTYPPDVVPSSSSAATGPARQPTTSTEGVPPKQARPSSRPVVNQSMDEDIDDMLELNSSRRTEGPDPGASGIPHIDAAFRNLPTEWRDQVRVDLQRQLVMPEQPPFSSGYTAIFSRKP